MVQLGFVIDHSRCIGCHACTVACKSENEVPLGNFRTWVKYTEEGSFPTVKRNYAVLRCNQCTAAPCIEICPTNALTKRLDGIVDLDQDACIGCKSCMQACPYDALYLNEETGTAEKCHFCAHRTELGLAPACAVVCPTEAIIPGDFHDPESHVYQLKASGQLQARKTEAGTGPNVLYKEAASAGLQPGATSSAGGYIWANQSPLVQYQADQVMQAAQPGLDRTVYNVEHPPVWGWKVSSYLFTKSISAGAFLAMLPIFGFETDQALMGGLASIGIPIIGLVFLAITTALLVLDLKRPERFLTILTRPNWKSWLVKGAYVLMAYGGLLSLWLVLAIQKVELSTNSRYLLVGVTALSACLAACYSAWLFGQAKGRVLWMKKGFAIHLIAQAVVAGAALLIITAPALELSGHINQLRLMLFAGLFFHAFFTIPEDLFAPEGREAEYHRVMHFLEHGPYSTRRWWVSIVLGIGLPAFLIIIPGFEALYTCAGLLSLVGLAHEEDVFVNAGQALPIS